MRPPRLLPALAAGALVLAACGDDDTSQTADTLAIQAEPAPGTDAPAPAAEAQPDAPAAEATDDGAPVDESGASDGDSAGGDTGAADQPAAEQPADEVAAAAMRSTRLDDGRIDLIGPDVDAAADVASNPLPSVVVDDLQAGTKVNFRNVAPQSQPILLWMYAPH